jgi:hypothetical protein
MIMASFFIGQWFVSKYVERFQSADAGDVARQLRKQGVPLNVTLALLRQASVGSI